jgi:hypothetical protein
MRNVNPLALLRLTQRGNLEGTWYKQVSFKEMKEAYGKCDTCKTLKDYWMLSSQIRERVRNSFKNEALESFKFSFDPENLNNFNMKGCLNYMPNLKNRWGTKWLGFYGTNC